MFIQITFNRTVTYEELQEVLTLAANQETTDKYVNCQLHIDGDHAAIDVSIDDEGNVTVL